MTADADGEQLDAPPAGSDAIPAQASVPDPIRHNDRVLIVGTNGSGKTVLARHLFAQMTRTRRTLVDPKEEHTINGVAPARLPAALDLAAPVSHYIPARLDEAEYEELFDLLWRAGGPRWIWLDEAYGPTRAGKAPQGLRLILQQGRAKDIGLAACSQRPVNIEATLRTEAQHIIVFTVPRPATIDLKTLAPDLSMDPDQLARELDDLAAAEGPYSHVWYCRRTGQLHRCAPLPSDWA